MSYFISGIPCSGTTLLVNLLGYHSELSPIYETDFVRQWARLIVEKPPSWEKKMWEVMDQWSKPLPHRPDSKKDYEKYPFGAHHILFNRDQAKMYTAELLEKINGGAHIYNATQKAITSLYEAHVSESDASQWINKTPMYLAMLPVLYELFPDMKLINCVRDGRDVAWSIKEREDWPDDTGKIMKLWVKLVKAGQAFAEEYPEQIWQIKYEDLINNTQKVLSECLNFLELEDESEQIVEDYPVEIYSKRIGVYKDKSKLKGFYKGKPKKMMKELCYI